LSTPDPQPDRAAFKSSEALAIHYKRRLSKAGSPEQEVAIRKAWKEAAEAFFAAVGFHAIEDVDGYFKAKLATAEPADESAVNIAWANARADFYERKWALAVDEKRAAEAAVPPVDEIELARRLYGEPAAGGAGPRPNHVSAPPSFQIRPKLPSVEVEETKP
jgi:hypothetical protein